MKTLNEIKEWIAELNSETHVKIEQTALSSSDYWFYDKKNGVVRNKNNSFFYITGIKGKVNDFEIEQPILMQNEIGYLGILCKKIDGKIYFLMQAKIEPGNVNCVQISPTIQATKSNFTQKHGGSKPLYLDYFLHAKSKDIIIDQIQSEQSSRFYRKRNRNMIVYTEKDVELEKRFCWMTLDQIHELMKEKNLVNMDTRTVLSCLPYIDKTLELVKTKTELQKSINDKNYIREITKIYNRINDYKMFSQDYQKIVRLDDLSDWIIDDYGIRCKHDYPYEVVYCDIEIEGREVKKWIQPLFKAKGNATFCLVYTIQNGVIKFLVKAKPEIGSFDKIEIGPTLQLEANELAENEFEKNIIEMMNSNKYIRFDSILSEEGGRFYHEENRNIILELPSKLLNNLPKDYFLLSYAALNHMNLINNCLNIQLRNLLSVLEDLKWEIE